MTAMGYVSNWSTSLPLGVSENLTVLLAATPPESTDQGCISGHSGGPAVAAGSDGAVIVNSAGDPLVVGTANAYDPLASGLVDIGYAQQLGFAISDYAGGDLCAIAPELPEPTKAQLIPVGAPGDTYDRLANDAQQWRDEFAATGYTPQVIQGIYSVDGVTIDNPAYWYDAVDDTLFLGACGGGTDSSPGDDLVVYAISDATSTLPQTTVYSDNGQAVPTLISAAPPISVPAPASAFEDTTGLEIGLSYDEGGSPASPTATPSIQAGQLVLAP